MNQSTRFTNFLRFLARPLALSVLMLSASAHAATINYFNFGPVPPGYTFIDVTESSGTDAVPLYGPPVPFAIGLDFDPKNFIATSVGGGGDVTDGQLNFSVAAGGKAPGIGVINLFEAGDYSLSGAGTKATQVLAGAILRATVTEINGVKVAPINLIPVNASVSFDLVANPGIVQPWSLGLALNVAGQLAPGQNATRVDVVINNQLLAFSESATLAFIAKKDFVIGIIPVPEPTTMLLGVSGFATVLGVGQVARRRKDRARRAS